MRLHPPTARSRSVQRKLATRQFHTQAKRQYGGFLWLFMPQLMDQCECFYCFAYLGCCRSGTLRCLLGLYGSGARSLPRWLRTQLRQQKCARQWCLPCARRCTCNRHNAVVFVTGHRGYMGSKWSFLRLGFFGRYSTGNRCNNVTYSSPASTIGSAKRQCNAQLRHPSSARAVSRRPAELNLDAREWYCSSSKHRRGFHSRTSRAARRSLHCRCCESANPLPCASYTVQSPHALVIVRCIARVAAQRGWACLE